MILAVHEYIFRARDHNFFDRDDYVGDQEGDFDDDDDEDGGNNHSRVELHGDDNDGDGGQSQRWIWTKDLQRRVPLEISGGNKKARIKT